MVISQGHVHHRANHNLIIDSDVKGAITVKLKNVTWKDAIDAILAEQGLIMVKIGSVYSVTTMENFLKRK